MKKILLSTILAGTFMNAMAVVVRDTVSTGATYANQVWYSLENDEQGNAPKNNWDLGFDMTGYGSGAMINSVTGTMVWKLPNGDTGDWATVDTTGLSTWEAHWNSDTSWALQAIGAYSDPNNPANLDWGVYNQTTHVVTGDSLYIIKLANGDYKKLWIVSLASGIYTFKFADLDGNNEQTKTIDKSAYTGKNFAYYSIQNGAALDREPASDSWDLTFTQYTTFIPTAYTVTGVLSNYDVIVAKAINVANKETYVNYAAETFKTPMNMIGYNWKSFNGTSYDIKDSVVYFAEVANGDIWKIVFRGFGGSANGNHIFTKEKLTGPNSVNTVNGVTTSVALYPNPANAQNVTVVYGFNSAVNNATLTVSDVTGKTVYTAALDNSHGMHQYMIPAQNLHSGLYIVNVNTGANTTTQKLIIQ